MSDQIRKCALQKRKWRRKIFESRRKFLSQRFARWWRCWWWTMSFMTMMFLTFSMSPILIFGSGWWRRIILWRGGWKGWTWLTSATISSRSSVMMMMAIFMMIMMMMMVFVRFSLFLLFLMFSCRWWWVSWLLIGWFFLRRIRSQSRNLSGNESRRWS